MDATRFFFATIGVFSFLIMFEPVRSSVRSNQEQAGIARASFCITYPHVTNEYPYLCSNVFAREHARRVLDLYIEASTQVIELRKDTVSIIAADQTLWGPNVC